MGGYAVEPKVLTVSQLNQYLKTRFDNDPPILKRCPTDTAIFP